MAVLVVTSGHWQGDPRLNRHVAYLRRRGVEADLVAPRGSRPIRALRALGLLLRRPPEAVILPDPELQVIGSLLARIRGVRAVIDIHENYSQAALARDWVPTWLRPVVSWLAGINDRIARALAHATLVAAPELATPGTHLVPNVPDPSDFTEVAARDGRTVVYVGDVTEARGALEMADLARLLPPEFRVLVIGRVDDRLAEEMMRRAGPDASLDLTGRLDHRDAWDRARGAIAGLSLLRSLPAYREAVATKLWEYCAAGIPPVVTDLPGQRSFVDRIAPELACRGVSEVADVVKRLEADPEWRRQVSERARGAAQAEWEARRPDQCLYEAVMP